MKTISDIKFMLKCFSLISLSLVATTTFMSCSSDEDDEPETKIITPSGSDYAKDSNEGMTMSVFLRTATSTDSLPDNFREITYEPTIGTVLDESQPYVRYVAVSSIDEARSEFEALCSGSYETIEGNTLNVGDVNLVYTEVNTSELYATVDVKVQQVPHLTQIRYVPASVFGDNATYDPYYSVGDVILADDGNYWVCIRPASENSEKGNCHWCTFGTTSENIKIKNWNGYDWYLPTKLVAESGRPEYIHYFIQLLALMNAAEEDAANERGNTLLNQLWENGGFTDNGISDMGTDDIGEERYKSANYITNLRAIWEKGNVWDKILPFGIDRSYFSKTTICAFSEGYWGNVSSYSIKYVIYSSDDCYSGLNGSKMDAVTVDLTHGFDVRDYILRGKATATSDERAPKECLYIRTATDKYFNSSYTINGGYGNHVAEIVVQKRITGTFSNGLNKDFKGLRHAPSKK